MSSKKQERNTNQRSTSGASAQLTQGTPEVDAAEGSYHLLVDCRSEENQRALFERLRDENFKCRVLTM